MLHNQAFLRTPGPTPIPQQVTHAMNQPMIGHRSQSFAQLFKGTSERLKPIFGTEQPVYTLTSSGTGALEAAVVNVTNPGDEIISVVAGAFGDRFASICEHHQLVTHRVEVPWGESVDQQELISTLHAHPNAKAVVMTYNETSTGVMQPIQELTKIVHDHSYALALVDGVSCIGAVPAQMDKWGIDILVTGSQKAMMLPPGLAFISASERAWDVIEQVDSSSFYFDLKAYHKQYENGMTPYTPAVSLIQGLKEVCTMLEEETLEKVYKRHVLMKDMTRAAFRALGLPLLTSDQDASPTVTAVKATEGLKVDEFRNHVRDRYGLSLAGGQKKLKGEIFRVGHMGYCSPVDVLTTLSIIEMGLVDCGISIELGAGVKAAQEVYINDVSNSSK
ncbi:aminotransferase class V-fold PLP-dependent enzyme [Pontibacillus yanchengensis]|uniref:Aminotransferase class V-fold PLP-dependent enzyme n=1 Tax=Pontibacillus yanchengensis TaxID=462910 RepID=A0ACC7VC88_9BACI|nr:alanine--glyoxylate aminotransferase family protein [Pontibacillus yanchengensis]MYL51779.1 aminotransferase class V-fold PLP-dependent enzyme [Pontibacillus yanchengensis]